MNFSLRIIIAMFLAHILLVLLVSAVGMFRTNSILSYTQREMTDISPVLIDTHTGIHISLLNGLGENSATISGRTPVWSPDGETVAFWTIENRNDIQVHQIQLRNYAIENLIEGRNFLSLPLYGADNQQLFAPFPHFSNVPIYLVNEDYPEGDILIESSQTIPVWSPDGRYVVYTNIFTPLGNEDEEITSGLDANEIDIYLTTVESRETVNLTLETGASGNPIWLPDSSGLLFVSNRDNFGKLHHIDLAAQSLTELPTLIRPIDRPVISPDGKYLAYASNIRSGMDTDLEVMILNLETYSTRNISTSPFYDYQPAWSPDGQELAFVSRRYGDQDEIFIFNMATEKNRRLTFTPTNEEDLMWRP